MTQDQIIGWALIGVVMLVCTGVVCYVLGYDAGRRDGKTCER